MKFDVPLRFDVPRRWLVVGGLGLALVLLITAGVVVTNIVRNRVDNALPSADLFDETPSPAPSLTPSPSPSPTPPPAGADIRGPLNFLLVGIDTRETIRNWRPNSDAVLILHVDKTLTRATLFSLPRDLLVNIPPFSKNGFGGARTKLTHAMSYGAVVRGTSRPNVAQGFQLLATTVSRYTGIARFDAGAVLNFGGLNRLVDAVGGITFYVDQRVVSRHRQPNGEHRPPGNTSTGYTGPQMVYEVGQRRMTGWQVVDYARQRYLPGGDYTRQRHQQQLIKALMGQILDRDLLTNPTRFDRVLDAMGSALVFDGRGRTISEFAYALRRLRPSAVTLVGLPGYSVGSGSGYRGEQLGPIASRFLAAVRGDRVEAFLRTNPSIINRG